MILAHAVRFSTTLIPDLVDCCRVPNLTSPICGQTRADPYAGLRLNGLDRSLSSGSKTVCQSCPSATAIKGSGP